MNCLKIEVNITHTPQKLIKYSHKKLNVRVMNKYIKGANSFMENKDTFCTVLSVHRNH